MRISESLLIPGLVMGLGLGAAIVLVADMIHDPLAYYHPSELSATERDTDLLQQKIPNIEIKLRFVDADTFHQENDPSDKSATTDAISQPHKAPCTITIPSGAEIDAVPRLGKAWFASYNLSNTIAHEMLHCIRGDWHPDWRICFANQAKRDKELHAYYFNCDH